MSWRRRLGLGDPEDPDELDEREELDDPEWLEPEEELDPLDEPELEPELLLELELDLRSNEMCMIRKVSKYHTNMNPELHPIRPAAAAGGFAAALADLVSASLLLCSLFPSSLLLPSFLGFVLRTLTALGR